MLRLTAEPCGPRPGRLLEGPVWDDRRQELLWVDIPDGLIHAAALAPHGAAEPFGPEPDRTLSMNRPTGAVLPCASGALVAVAGTSVWRLDGDGPPREIAAPGLPDDGVPRRMNDAACDPGGRLLAGTMAYDERPGAGTLYALDARGLRTLLTPVTISNGLGWSPDGRQLYYADSPTGRVDTFDYDPATGALADRRPFASLTGGLPDGLTVDTEGRVWVAVWGAGQVRAFHPDGTPYATVDVAASHVSSCAFAGPGRDLLVVTTATEGLTGDRRRAEPHAGRLFTCRPGATGLPATPFDDITASATA